MSHIHQDVTVVKDLVLPPKEMRFGGEGYAGDLLIYLGYAKDSGWVSKKVDEKACITF